MSVTLRSRLPEIEASLPLRVGAAVHAGTEAIAAAAKERVPVLSGELRDSIEARGGNAKTGEAFGIWAAWYWFLVEFGTSHSAAEPFLIPSAEAGLATLEAEVRTALREL